MNFPNNDFAKRIDISVYDNGGKGAVAGDGKLTGEEVKRANADGYSIWQGFTQGDKAITCGDKTAKEDTIREMANSETFQKVKELQEQIYQGLLKEAKANVV